jgi:penicillin-binding protein 1C
LSEVRSAFHSSEALVLDRQGSILQEVRLDLKARRLAWTPLAEVSPAVVSAVLTAEDRRFRVHHGVDWAALAGAAFQGAAAGRLRGASTITMQTAGFLEQGLAPRNTRRGPSEKVRQIRAALALERSWTKDEILEAYLNLVAARGEFQGISALSQGLFGKQPHGISQAEAAVLAALLRQPGAAFDAILKRGRAVSRSVGWTLPESDLVEAASQAFRGGRGIRPAGNLAPLAGRRLLGRAGSLQGGAVLSSTLDAGLQKAAADILRERLAGLADRNAKDGAVLVADNATGEVLAYVGNNGPDSSAPHVDGIAARRQAGSTLKPFLYALAFDRRVLTPASPVDDSPVDVMAGRGVFKPENYDRRFRGWITVRQALAGSVNIPAVRTLTLLGTDAFVETLDALGFTGLADGDFYGPSLALGSADVSLWELVAAYRTLARGGTAGPLRMARPASVPDLPHVGGRPVGRQRVFSRSASWLVADILSDRTSRSSAFGLESPLDTRFWSAVKTGTSKDMRDNWCVGFSERYTVGVWVGNFSGEPMWNVSGVSGAAPVWQAVMSRLHAGTPSRPPKPPAGLAAAVVTPLDSGLPVQEWFLAGTEPGQDTLTRAQPRPRILSPVSGETIALDFDIPTDREAVSFKAVSGEGLAWRLDGQELGPAGEALDWRPIRGRHLLELVGAGGRPLDRAEFTVRGESPLALSTP